MTASEQATLYRPTLLAIAYRMTGEIMVSEDIVQEVLLNWVSRSAEGVNDAKAYLAKSVVNTALNYLARVKREREAYKGTWLPEPVLATQHAIDAKLDISYGFMLLLEKLAPLERAVFVLKESFEVPYNELAQLFNLTEAHSRQLYHRAKAKLSEAPRRFAIDPQHQKAMLTAFAQASETGDLNTLVKLFKADVVLYTDGGGKVPAAINPLAGATVVELFLRSLTAKYGDTLSIRPAFVNGDIALLSTQRDTQQISTVMILEFDEEGGIHRIYSVRNPDKLASLN